MQNAPLYFIEKHGFHFVRVGKSWFYLPTAHQLQRRISRAYHKIKNKNLESWASQVMLSIKGTEGEFRPQLCLSEGVEISISSLTTTIVATRQGERVVRPTEPVLLSCLGNAKLEAQKPKRIAELVVAELYVM